MRRSLIVIPLGEITQDEALEIAQWAGHSAAAVAVQQMGARFGSGSGVLATLVRENQDLAAAWRDKDKTLLAAISKPESQQDRATIEVLRKQIAEIESRLAAGTARLDKEFPDYAALARASPRRSEKKWSSRSKANDDRRLLTTSHEYHDLII